MEEDLNRQQQWDGAASALVSYYCCLNGVASASERSKAATKKNARRSQQQPAKKKAPPSKDPLFHLPALLQGRGADEERTERFVAECLDKIDMERWLLNVRLLASFNRYSFGYDQVRPTQRLPVGAGATCGVDQARDELVGLLQGMPGMQVEVEPFQVRGLQGFNVIATLSPSKEESKEGEPLEGGAREERRTKLDERHVIVGAHYDSISKSPMEAAPGAVDNASGTAAVLEMAYIFSEMQMKATQSNKDTVGETPCLQWPVKFILFSGEEQGLRGSYHHATELKRQGKADTVLLMINMDMIAWRRPPDFGEDVMKVESEPPHDWAIELVCREAQTHSTLPTWIKRTAAGSDHTSFIEANIPAVSTGNKDCALYEFYHTTKDDVNQVDVEIATQFVRTIAATIARIAFS
ncbi:Aminopeptidase [Balamuthia mandrillaris]